MFGSQWVRAGLKALDEVDLEGDARREIRGGIEMGDAAVAVQLEFEARWLLGDGNEVGA